jgi:diguanylate cyclase (GGDEF)-like protein
MAPDAYSRSRLLRRAAPFSLGIGAAFGLAALPPYPADAAPVLAAGIWTALVIVAVVAVPWRRLPAFLQPAPALALLPPIALLSHADGEALPVYAPLAVLPVIWIALFGGRRALLLALSCLSLMFVVPVAAQGADFYASPAWKFALLSIVSAGVLSFATEGLVRRVRRRAAEASVHAEALTSQAESTRQLLESARALAATLGVESARRAVCEAAHAVANASFTALLEPDDGTLVTTAVSGLELSEPIRIAVGRETSACVLALSERRSLFVPDVRADATVSKRLAAATGVVSVQFEPVLRGDHGLGVLVVGWREQVAHSQARTHSLGLIAAEAAMALERAQLLEKLETAARTDALTGLPNRRGWEDELGRELAQARRSGAPLCVAVVDLDFFKHFNDARGHQAGDRLLKAAATAWRSALRSTDVLARYGGEEFTLAFPACSLDDALRIVERLRSATPGGQTVSAGIAQWDAHETAASLFARADKALYSSKRSGKDCVTLAHAA